MKLLVGLGNPGPEYAANRHNIGFLALDAIAAKHRLGPWKRRFHGETADGFVDGMKVVALKPLTYMNLSGQSVGEAARFLKIAAADTIVIHDELDLPPAKLRVKTGGGHGGHNGLKSIDAHLGTKDYVRVRLGIGHPGDKDRVADYVLHDFGKGEAAWVGDMTAAIAADLGLLIAGKAAQFMNKVGLAMNPAPTK
ncbi:MAG: aminoacyl-tRNA hydrolase [Azospirillum sp.]|nr:aminoacyl-tRNA hydrolase [Azospirillum sp.]